MTDTVLSFVLFWGIWLLVPLFIDGSTAIAYLIGAFVQARRNRAVQEVSQLEHYPMVSILIPVHNGAPYMRACIESLRHQAYPHEKIEILVMDNLSYDNGFEVFSEEQAKPFAGRLLWVSIPQRGKSYALNAGIFLCSGTYIINIDCDVVLHKNAIFNAVKAFEADPELAAATGAIEVSSLVVPGHPLRHLIAECEFLEYYAGFNIGRQYQSATNSLYTLAGAFSVFRRDILLNTFLYDRQTVSEDTKLTFELQKKFAHLKKTCIPSAIAYTPPTKSLASLYAQRVRWQRGQLEVASLFPEYILFPLKLKGFASSKTLLVDHTLAFARIVWTFLLPTLYFLGYSLSMVASATFVTFCCYVVVEGIYISACYVNAQPSSKLRIRRNWWLFAVMPLYRFVLFWFRLGGFISVLNEPSEWSARDPFSQANEGLVKLRRNLFNHAQPAAGGKTAKAA